MLYRSTAATVLFASIFFLVGCDKAGKQHGTFMATGRLLSDCSNTPLANTPVSISFYEESSSSRGRPFSGVVGSGTTSSDGTFSVECAYYGDDGYVSLTSDGINISSQAYIPERRMDFGTIYREIAYSGLARISVSVPYTSSDTLFFGNNASYSPETAVFPIASVQTVPFTQIIRWTSLQDAGLNRDTIRGANFWGIGRAQFDSAVSSKLDPPNFWQLNLRRCSDPVDVTDVTAE